MKFAIASFLSPFVHLLQVDPLFQQQAAAYDDGGTVELRLNQLRTYSKYSELLQDSSTPLFHDPVQESITCSTRPTDITGLLENPRVMEAPLCSAFDQFYFGKYDPSGVSNSLLFLFMKYK